MLETLIISATTFFATVGPFDVAAIYAALTAYQTSAEKRVTAVRSTLLAGIILLIFAFIGGVLLKSLGISMPAFRTAGGILLLLIGIEMVFARESGAGSATPAEQQEATTRGDISVFPLAMPLIAGPGSMSAVVLLMARANGEPLQQAAVLIGLLLILLLTLTSMLLANQLQKFLGITGMHVISRVFGVLLTALAVQFIFDGIAQSELLNSVILSG